MIPQIIYLILAGFGFALSIMMHGKPRKPHNAYSDLVAALISFGLLYWGGFFSGLFGQ